MKPPNLNLIGKKVLHKQKGTFKLPAMLKVALDISKGMNYLHQNHIIHRYLKSANLLMDENEVVKVADFGVARVQSESQKLEHTVGWLPRSSYTNHMVLRLMYSVSGSTPLWPPIPKSTHPKLAQLLDRCWQKNPDLKPDSNEIIIILQHLVKEMGSEDKAGFSLSNEMSHNHH